MSLMRPARSRAGFPRRAPLRLAPTCLLATLVTVLALLPTAGAAEASTRAVGPRAAASAASVSTSVPTTTAPMVTSAKKKKAKRATIARARAKARAKARVRTRSKAHARARARARAAGVPTARYVIPQGSYFSYPNRSASEQLAIRNRVLLTIRSTWGGRRSSLGTPLPTNGRIRITTWSFDDWAIARALVAARNRGVSVQVMAAQAANGGHGSFKWLRKRLGSDLYRPGHPSTRETYSFARQCRGSCRGYGGTAHAKYFLFDNVGARHTRRVVVNTSMNLTRMAYEGQWNQAQVMYSNSVFQDFMSVFRQARTGRQVRSPFHVKDFGRVADLFFPRPNASAPNDPVMQLLGKVRCRGATSGGTRSGQTRIRIIQYAMYGDRGVWIAKRLRYLWNRGCNIAIIYSVSSRPVLSILRSGSGRGAIPMRQSVVKDPWGNIVKYNHSKWMTITGRYGRSTGTSVTFTGSANWSRLAFGSDEQMQRLSGWLVARRYLATFARTWQQGSSRPPSFGRVIPGGRMLPPLDVPEEEPDFGHGVFRHMTQD